MQQEQQKVHIVWREGADGTLSAHQHSAIASRQSADFQRTQIDRSIWNCAMGVAAMLTSIAGVFAFASVFAAATRPTPAPIVLPSPPPPVNPKCVAFCGN